MLSCLELKKGTIFVLEGAPYMVLLAEHQHIGRGGATITLRIKNIKTGKVLERNYKSNEQFSEGDIEKIKVNFLYHHRNQYWFTEIENPKNRFELDDSILGDSKDFLKPNMEVTALKFEGTIFNIELPIKVDYRVIESPPSVKGNTAQGGTKAAIIESGAKVLVPLFINEGDIIRINTQTQEYVERVDKS